MEYQVRRNAIGLQAANRAHNLRTYFEETGVRVQNRTEHASRDLLEMALKSVGRQGESTSVGSGDVQVRGSRVEIHRPKQDLVEWYINSPDGVEQGFTIGSRPPGTGSLVLDVDVSGAAVSSRAEDLIFHTEDARRLLFSKLEVEDAHKTRLLANFVPTPTGYQIVVDDAGAIYPIEIDPILTAVVDSQLESDQADAQMGISVAGAGDVNGDGYADVIVGAYLYDSGETDEGAAFLFYGSAAGIADSGPSGADAVLESNQAGARLGIAVSGAGDVNGDGFSDIIVGADSYDAGEADEGAAFVFLGSASGIASGSPSTAHAMFESNQSNSQFGVDVADAGDTNGDGFADVLIGAPSYDSGESDEGGAFLFLGSSAGLSSGTPATSDATFQSDQAGARLGVSVSGAGDVNADGYADIVLGANRYDLTASADDEGAAFLFLGSASGIADGNPMTADAQLEGLALPGDGFGVSVAGVGDVDGDGYADVGVVADFNDLLAGTISDTGMVFVNYGQSGGLEQTSDPIASPSDSFAGPGMQVAGAGDVNGDGFADVLIGVPQYSKGGIDGGVTFVAYGQRPRARISGAPTRGGLQIDQASASFGFSVAAAGDVNGDGFDDVVVGANGYDAGESNEGAAFVYYGGAGAASAFQIRGVGSGPDPVQAGANFGFSVSNAGDVNGDGFEDVIVGAPLWDGGGADEGIAIVSYGNPDGNLNEDVVLRSFQTGSLFGYSVAGAGDVDGDGYHDILVGAPRYDSGESDEGAAFLFKGSGPGLVGTDPSTAFARFESNQDGAYLGFNVASAGDVNRDGLSDIVIGSRFYDHPEVDEGIASIFYGGTLDISANTPTSAWADLLESDQTNAQFGFSVDGAGDINGDGFADVVVGAVFYDAGEADEGAAFIFHGAPSGVGNRTPTLADTILKSDQALAQFGHEVASAGDVNGDGFADVVVGANLFSNPELNEGGAPSSFTGTREGFRATRS